MINKNYGKVFLYHAISLGVGTIALAVIFYVLVGVSYLIAQSYHAIVVLVLTLVVSTIAWAIGDRLRQIYNERDTYEGEPFNE